MEQRDSRRFKLIKYNFRERRKISEHSFVIRGEEQAAAVCDTLSRQLSTEEKANAVDWFIQRTSAPATTRREMGIRRRTAKT